MRLEDREIAEEVEEIFEEDSDSSNDDEALAAMKVLRHFRRNRINT